MYIAIGAIIHESNTFNPNPTRLVDFDVERGDEMIARWQAAHHEVGGFISGAATYATHLMPTLSAFAVPAGRVTREAFETLVGELIERLQALPRVDGLLLALHGAMVAEHYQDADGEIARRVRAALGSHKPIVCTYDPHANISPLGVASVDVLLTYKTNPHVDQRERGLQAASLLGRMLRGEVQPVQALRQPGLLLNIVHQNTNAEPLRSVMEAAQQLEAEPGVLAASVALGYQYADVYEMGPAVVVATDGDAARAEREAERLCDMLWSLRPQLRVARPDAATAVAQAMTSAQQPVVLVDMGDNIGGGSAGDSTFLLAELLRQQARGWVVVIADPAAVQTCAAAGIGAHVALDVGGKTDQFHGSPVAIRGRVTCLHDGRYIETEARHGGARYNEQGLTALVELDDLGYDPASLVLLTSRREAPLSLHQLLSVGIQPQRQRILVVKAAIAYRAAYEPIASTIIEVDTPGVTTVNPAHFTFAHIRQPLWGLDMHAEATNSFD